MIDSEFMEVWPKLKKRWRGYDDDDMDYLRKLLVTFDKGAFEETVEELRVNHESKFRPGLRAITDMTQANHERRHRQSVEPQEPASQEQMQEMSRRCLRILHGQEPRPKAPEQHELHEEDANAATELDPDDD